MATTWAGTGATESTVYVLTRRDDRLTPTGQVTGLGRGERIFSVRFLGGTGYVVTFRQTDPLYALDLTDPTAPRVTGELNVRHPAPVSRSLLVDGELWTVSEAGLRVTDPTNARSLDWLPTT